MNSFDPLTATLLDLSRALGSGSQPLTVGGGFGLYLKQRLVQETGLRTLLTELPVPRTTNDIDLFLRADVLVDVSAMQRMFHALTALEFQAVESARYFQWVRKLSDAHEVKIDLLVGPLGELRSQLKTNKPPRVRPKGDVQLHAHATEEAIEIDTRSAILTLEGNCTDGTAYSTQVYVPQAFTYLMMKLFAFDDRKNDESRDVGRHHAMDLYRIVAMMTEAEYAETLELCAKYASDQRIAKARRIVAADFGMRTSLGVLRFREHNLYSPSLQTDAFIQTLSEVFVAP